MNPENVFNKTNPLGSATKEDIIADMNDQNRFLKPLVARKELVLTQLKNLDREIKKHKNTIYYLSKELEKFRED